MLIALAASEENNLEGADVSNAYLYRDHDVSITIEQSTDSAQDQLRTGMPVSSLSVFMVQNKLEKFVVFFA